MRAGDAALAGAAVVAMAIACGRVDTDVGAEHDSVYFEAESGRLSGGFTIASDPSASGGQCILPPAGVTSAQAPGLATAEYTFHLNQSATYLVWGRIRFPGVQRNTVWVTVDAGPTYLWRLSTGATWFWGRVTNGTDYGHPIPFALSAGDHRLVLRNSEPGVELDRFFISIPGDVPPGNDTPCDPPNSIQLSDGGCEKSCGSFMNTTCGSVACAGQVALVAYDCDICCKDPEAGTDGGATAE